MSQLPSSSVAWTDALESAGYYASFTNARTINEWMTVGGLRGAPLVIKGPQYAGKKVLAKAITEVIEGDSSAASERRRYIVYYPSMKFEDLFYAWDGPKRDLMLRHGITGNRTVGEVRRDTTLAEHRGFWWLIDQTFRVNHLILDHYRGPSDDERCNSALAEFAENRRILIPEIGGEITPSPDHRFCLFVILSSYKDEDAVARGEFYDALMKNGVLLKIENPDRHRQLEVLGRLAPNLDRRVLQEYILFAELFNTMPGLDEKIAFGYMTNAVRLMEGDGVRQLTPGVLRILRGLMAKTPENSRNYDAIAEEVLKMARQMQF